MEFNSGFKGLNLVPAVYSEGCPTNVFIVSTGLEPATWDAETSPSIFRIKGIFYKEIKMQRCKGKGCSTALVYYAVKA